MRKMGSRSSSSSSNSSSSKNDGQGGLQLQPRSSLQTVYISLIVRGSKFSLRRARRWQPSGKMSSDVSEVRNASIIRAMFVTRFFDESVFIYIRNLRNTQIFSFGVKIWCAGCLKTLYQQQLLFSVERA